MYSVVLLAAMTTSPATPDFAKHRGGGGCCGQTSCGCYGAEMACGCHGGGGKKHRHHGGGGCCGQSSCGCYGMSSCAPAPTCGCCGGMGGMMQPMTMPAPKAGETGPTPKTGMANPNAATIVVSGAQDATVTIGGLVSAGNGETRTLVSPDLDAGQVYHYDLTAEVVRDGKTVKVTEGVTVRPGETTEVRLDFAAGAVVMK